MSEDLLIDPTPALLVVDLQKGILRMPPAEAVETLVSANERLVNAFHDAHLPVVWIHATGLPAGRVERPLPQGELPDDFTHLDDRLDARDEDLHVYKPLTWSAFIRTDLADQLRNRGVTQVVVAGIATGAGVESTARNAYDEGFTVTVVGDACLDGNAARHANTLAEAVPSFGHATIVDAVLAALPH